MAADLPNLVRMECSLLAGLVAEKLVQHAAAEGAGNLSRVFFLATRERRASKRL